MVHVPVAAALAVFLIAAETASASTTLAVSAARARELAAEPGWLKLLHYRHHFLGAESEPDGPGFFLAPDGKRNPRSELVATIAALLAPGASDDAHHAQCRFPARLAWLQAHHAFDGARLTPARCDDWRQFRDQLSGRSLTLVFSSYYLNNPASAFGHTFLRLNRVDTALAGSPAELVDYGLDFAATADARNPFLYAIKGLTGLFRGEWTYRPYFYKVRQYADYEARDLWEYDLALSEAEVELFVAHLWELRATWFDYYFLTENCSYGVLAALEAAAPRLELLRHLGPIVVPADTVKALYQNPGLVRATHFRPSIRSQFETRAARLVGNEPRAVMALIEDPTRALPAGSAVSQVRILDAALDYVDLSHAHELLEGVMTPAATLKQKLLERRSELLVQSDDLVVPTAPTAEPHLGHGSARTSLGAGASSRKGPLTTVDVRLGLHDLVDPPAGYPSLSRIDFLRLRLRYQPRANALGVEDAVFADFMSLADYGAFERHLSWEARLGATTVRDGGCDDCLAGVMSGSAGLAQVMFKERLTAYAMADAEVLGTPALSGAGGTGLRLGVGPKTGVRLHASERVSFFGEAGWRWLPAAEPRTTFDVHLEARLHMNGWSAFAEASRWPAESQVVFGASIFL